MKIKYKDSLSLDVSLAIVSNRTIHGVPVAELVGADKESESVLQAVLTC